MVREDVTDSVRLLLTAVNATKGRYGLTMPIEVLMGRKTARVKQQSFDNLPVHGSGADRSEEYWKAVGDAAISECLLDGQSSGKGFGKKQLLIYSVSVLGQKMLSGDYVCPVFADVTAHAQQVQGEREARAAKKARAGKRIATPRQNASSPTVAPPTLTSSAVPETGSSSGVGTQSQRLEAEVSFAEGSRNDNGLQPAPHPEPIKTASSSSLPKKLEASLLPYQRAGVAFAVQRSGRVLIGDDMGLGKTIQGLAICAAFRRDWPALLVVPNSVRLMWADELARWIPDIGPWGVNLVKSGQDLFGLKDERACFHIVTYGILTRASAVRDFLRAHHFKIVLVDESHMMKNKDTQRTQEILRATSNAAHVVLLSGTPALARPIELFTQVEAVQPGLFGSYSNFTKRFCDPKWTPFGMDVTGASNLEELHALLRPIMVRRLKRDVLTELPSKRRQRVQIEVSADRLAECAAIRDQSGQLDTETQAREKRRLLMQLYRTSSEAKIEPVCEYVEDLINGGCKFLVFAHHLVMLDALEAAAVRCKVQYIRIDGGVNSHERTRRVAEFQSNEKVQIAILAIQAAGVGLTLTAASTVVFAELHWTPGVLVQAEDRVHRIGQKSSVNIHYLVATGTIDDIIWSSVANKVEIVSAFCDGHKDRLVAKLTSTDNAMNAAGLSLGGRLAGMGQEDLDDEGEGLLAASQSVPSFVQKTGGNDNEKSKHKSGYSVLSMLQGKGPTSRIDCWICGSCSVRNAAGTRICSMCSSPRKEVTDSLPRRFAQGPSCESEKDALIIDVEGVTEPASDLQNGHSIAASTATAFVHGFVVSRDTGRIHVMNAGDQPVGFNFKLIDWEVLITSEETPREVVSETSAFLAEWAALLPTEQRQLVDQVLRPPLRAALHMHKASTARTRKRARVDVTSGEAHIDGELGTRLHD
eukprot:TRINITY_DN16867_c0_g2_i2.p1 TRINITY_DN16867_c0_g2~~TRINITY_DN16867_c0_g2_i2.p1  ORF type:complete len:926 (-),score=144.06 TRINITY_DN16867_c0_g2_i2:153-2930(-)